MIPFYSSCPEAYYITKEERNKLGGNTSLNSKARLCRFLGNDTNNRG
jgi:hypothetical protein